MAQSFHPFSKFLIGTGIILIIVGLLWHFGGRFLPLGRLPGDISIERQNFRFYFPVATSILISVVLSLIMILYNKFSR